MRAATVLVCMMAASSCGGAPVEAPAPPPSKPEPPPPPQRKLAPPPTQMTMGQFWPSRICTRGAGLIVVSNTCICDSKMTCAIKHRGGTLDLHVGMSQDTCKDCGTFQATCEVPPSAMSPVQVKNYKITLDGRPVLSTLELPKSNSPATEHCYE